MRQPVGRIARRPSCRRITSLALAIAAVATIVGGTLTLAVPGPVPTGRTPGVLMAPQRWAHPSSGLRAA
jgi:hypothetical protein